MNRDVDSVLESIRHPASCVSIVRSMKLLSEFVNHSQNDMSRERKKTFNLAIHLSKSRESLEVWCGVNLIYISVMEEGFCLENGPQIIDILTTVMGSLKAGDALIVKACCRCLLKVAKIMRGKFSATREIYTPRLPQILNGYLSAYSKAPSYVSKALRDCLKNHPTTCRPYLSRIREEAVKAIVEAGARSYNLPRCQPVASLLSAIPMAEKENSNACWGETLDSLIGDILATFLIFHSCIKFSFDEVFTSIAEKYSSRDSEFLFPSLSIEMSSLGSIKQIADRIQHLLMLTQTFLISSTEDQVSVPIGRIIQILTTVCSTSLGTEKIKSNFRDSETKLAIEGVLHDVQRSFLSFAFMMMSSLKGFFLPYSQRLIEAFSYNAKTLLDKKKRLSESHLDVKPSLLSTGQLIYLMGIYPIPSELSNILSLTFIGLQSLDESSRPTDWKTKKQLMKANGNILGTATSEISLSSSLSSFYDITVHHSNVSQELFCRILNTFLKRFFVSMDLNQTISGEERRRICRSMLGMAKYSAAPIALFKSFDAEDEVLNTVVNPLFPFSKRTVSADMSDECSLPDSGGKRSSEEEFGELPSVAKKMRLDLSTPKSYLSDSEIKLEVSVIPSNNVEYESDKHLKLISASIADTLVSEPNDKDDHDDDEGADDDIEIPLLDIEPDSDAES